MVYRESDKITKGVGKLKLLIRTLTTALLIFVILVLIWSQKNLIISSDYVLKLESLPKSYVGYNIAHITNLDNCGLSPVDRTKEINPDIIIISGGYTDSNGKFKNSRKVINELTKIAPVYCILGKDDDEAILDGTEAINITNKTIDIRLESREVNDFIKSVYGKDVLNDCIKSKGDYKEYYEYIKEALKNSEEKTISITGIQNDKSDKAIYNANDIKNRMLETNNSDLHFVVIDDLSIINSVVDEKVNIVFAGGTYGVDRKSEDYKKGVYGVRESTLCLSSGIGTPSDVKRVFNFPEVQHITLSDGTIQNKNMLEKILDKNIKDIGTIFDNDDAYKSHKTTYENNG